MHNEVTKQIFHFSASTNIFLQNSFMRKTFQSATLFYALYFSKTYHFFLVTNSIGCMQNNTDGLKL